MQRKKQTLSVFFPVSPVDKLKVFGTYVIWEIYQRHLGVFYKLHALRAGVKPAPVQTAGAYPEGKGTCVMNPSEGSARKTETPAIRSGLRAGFYA